MKFFFALIAAASAADPDCLQDHTATACVAAVKGSANCPTGWTAKTIAEFSARSGVPADGLMHPFLAVPAYCQRSLSGTALDVWCSPVSFASPWPASFAGRTCSLVSDTTDKWLGVGTGTKMASSQAVVVNGDQSFDDTAATDYMFTLNETPRGATAAAAATDHKLRPRGSFPRVVANEITGKNVMFNLDLGVLDGIWAVGAANAPTAAHASRGTFGFGFTSECVGLALTTVDGCADATTSTTTTTGKGGTNDTVLPGLSCLIALFLLRAV